MKNRQTFLKLDAKTLGLALAVLVPAGQAACASDDASAGTGTTASKVGALDTTFGKSNDGTPDGIVSVSLGDGNDLANAVVVQADGKVVVAGHHVNGTSTDVVVARFNTDGSLDATFGTANDGTPDGVVNISLGAGDDFAYDLAVAQDGKLLVAGDHVNGTSHDLFVARLNADGTLDATFSPGTGDATPDGIANVSLGDGDDFAKAVAVTSDGKVYVAGDHVNGASHDIFVARFTAAGELDATFGTANDGTPDGVVNLSLGDGDDLAKDLALQSDGKVVVAGAHVNGASHDLVVARFTTDGVLDASFGKANDGTPDGVVHTSLGDGDDLAKSVALQADGKIVVAGDHVNGASNDLFVARYTTDGVLDATFGTANDGTPDGVVNLSLGAGNDFGNAVKVAADGKLVLAGCHVNGTSKDVFVARLDSAGALDATFSPGADDTTPAGVANFSLGNGDDTAKALALQADGKILVAGDHVNGTSSDIFVLRVLAAE